MAKTILNISDFCLSDMHSPADLLRTCLIAIPTPASVLLHHFYIAEKDPDATEEDVRTHLMLYDYCRDCPTNFHGDRDMIYIITHDVTSGDVCYQLICDPNHIPKCQPSKLDNNVFKS